jgi:hypothetical protein
MKMYKNILRQIVVFLFSAIFVVASGGFSLIYHYCACSDDFTCSVLVERSDCHDKSTFHLSIDSDEMASSCCHEKKCLSQNKLYCNDDHNCCTTKFFYLQTDDFDLSGKNKAELRVLLDTVFKNSDISDPEKISDNCNYQLPAKDPPLASGKKLLVSIHQLKIASVLV